MRIMNWALTIGAMSLLGGCGGSGSPPDVSLKPMAGSGSGAAASCPSLGSRNWRARLVRVGGSKLKLTVDGEVDLPTPGYTAVWKEGLSDRANPPGLHLMLSFTPPSQDDMVAQVVTINQVHYSAEVSYPRYRYILVRCGDGALTQLSEVRVEP